MDVDHPNAQLGRRRNRMRGGIGNIVEFQVEKHVETAPVQIAHQLRPKQREHFFAHFQPAVLRIDTVGERQRSVLIGVI